MLFPPLLALAPHALATLTHHHRPPPCTTHRRLLNPGKKENTKKNKKANGDQGGPSSSSKKAKKSKPADGGQGGSSSSSKSGAATHHMKQNGEPDELLEGVLFATDAEIAALANLKDQRVALTGSMANLSDFGFPPASGTAKKEAELQVKALDGAWKDSVSSTTTILVVGPRANKCGGGKTQKAKEMRASGGAIAFWTTTQLACFLEQRRGIGAAADE